MLAKKLSEDISNILGTALGDIPRPVPLHAPVISNIDFSNVNDCLSSGWVSSVGAYVNQFEDRLCEITGARHAVAVVNGTSALHLSLVACGIRPEDEVLVPAFTFVATPNAVSYCGAIPHFVDSDRYTLGLDPVALSKYLLQYLFHIQVVVVFAINLLVEEFLQLYQCILLGTLSIWLHYLIWLIIINWQLLRMQLNP